MTPLSFPPLFTGEDTRGEDPLHFACARAQAGCDAGLVAYDLRADVLHAALVFAPEVPLRKAAIMLPICGIGFQNALGALAPPEIAVHLDWTGGIRINGGTAGLLKMVASPASPDQVPDWMVVGLELALWPASAETGNTPDVTALISEGCGDVEAPALLEAWVRHTLVWINRWSEDGPRAIHSEWSGLVHGLEKEAQVRDIAGVFKGVDEDFGMILHNDDGNQIIPITDILTEVP
ncbi:biotin/lipoate--protein ligase family protein [Roseobacter litoralis]|uniref:biotin/lipoate--protein ligase family protein n=1 Tax=Roseobacter litoralis TaxID=42443 RepID=UPI0024930D8B|nr:biotin/lipoate--protein ligase family protein [Roseobacter litoralis]